MSSSLTQLDHELTVAREDKREKSTEEQQLNSNYL